MPEHNLEPDYHCIDCNAEWDYAPSDQRCPYCDSAQIQGYPKPQFKPQQWVRYKPHGPLYPAKNEQIAQVRRDGQGGWLYVLPKWLDQNRAELAEFSEDALEPGEYESRQWLWQKKG